MWLTGALAKQHTHAHAISLEYSYTAFSFPGRVISSLLARQLNSSSNISGVAPIRCVVPVGRPWHDETPTRSLVSACRGGIIRICGQKRGCAPRRQLRRPRIARPYCKHACMLVPSCKWPLAWPLGILRVRVPFGPSIDFGHMLSCRNGRTAGWLSVRFRDIGAQPSPDSIRRVDTAVHKYKL